MRFYLAEVQRSDISLNEFPQKLRLSYVNSVAFRISFLLSLTTILFGSSSVLGDDKIDFASQIRPLLSDRCLMCHGPDANTREADLRLDVPEVLTRVVKNKPIILPGKPEQSELFRRITTADPSDQMPPKESGLSLSPKEKELIRRWIAQGAPWSKHWSLIPPKAPTLPSQLNNSWIKDPLDAYVLRRLQKERLSPSPEALKEELLRRVTLDLIGLPPSIDDLEAFHSDDQPGAYERVVERLLASPAFGERWGRVWLDLARYADSAGYAQDPARTIWRYRDWVIEAFNKNQSFDEFTIDQLAGDLRKDPTEDQLIATAFHRNTMTNSEGGTNDEEFRTAAIVDRVNTTLQVWMGLTMGCAQCHTHKYDPITQEDYFRFYAIFNNTEDADHGDERPLLSTYSEDQKMRRAYLMEQEKETLSKITKAESELSVELPISKGELKTRYIRIDLKGQKRILSLAEVQAFVGTKNVAVKAKARQGSTGFGGPAHFAVDGNTNGHYTNAMSTTHTNIEDDPWWEVDLGQDVVLDEVKVWNRTDTPGIGDRIRPFILSLLNKDRKQLLVIEENRVPNPSLGFKLPKRGEDRTQKQIATLKGYLKPDSPELANLRKRLTSIQNELKGIKPTTTPILRELPENRRRTTQVLIRGNFLDRGKKVGPGVLDQYLPLTEKAKPNRLMAARWLVDSKNPLTARVTVNRFWEQLFGIGLVETSEDFGNQGTLPSHPELLDYLATWFVDNDWNVKGFLKKVVTSATYRQSSKLNYDLRTKDPYNRFLARGPRFRLSAEKIRDQALALGGLLSTKMYGPSVRPVRPNLGLRAAFGGSTDWRTSPGEDSVRRGLYTSWRRTTPYPSMTTFDAPSREFCTLRRIRTNTPLQALVLLNDPVYLGAARGVAYRVITEGGEDLSQRLKYLFKLCLSRMIKQVELQRLKELFQEIQNDFKTDSASAMALIQGGPPIPPKSSALELATWTIIGNVILNLDELILRK